jgi:acetyltransferase-like isoleucine patch superfamily enzyme
MGNMCIIEDGAKIGDGVEIGNFCIIGKGCRIGSDSILKSNVELREETIIGNKCYIDSGVKSSGSNVIRNEVTLRYDAIIARGCDIGDRSYICPQVMTNNVDHNGDQIGGATVEEDCFIGTNSTLGAGITICSGSLVGSKSMVTKDIAVKGVYVGVPAKLLREF